MKKHSKKQRKIENEKILKTKITTANSNEEKLSVTEVISDMDSNLKTLENENKNNDEMLDYLKNISNSISSLVSLLEKNVTIQQNQTIIEEKIIEQQIDDSFPYKQNTLLISYLDKKVILPFTEKELNKTISENPKKYKTLEDVVNALYTKPLDYYKNSSLSRFKEAFKLIKEREHGSFKDAIDLGLEVFTNFNIHPAIITACKDLNEFDIYLSCLEYNELEDFHFFNIDFSMPPVLTDSAKVKDIFKKLKNTIKKDIIQT